MAFCKYSQSFSLDNKTLVDNIFINEFLPKAPDLCVKAYILGLSKCSSPESEDNSLDYFAEKLKVCPDDVVSLFKYWEDMGLVQVLSTDPIEVRYLPITKTSVHVKKFQVDKYADFNIQMQELFSKRMIMPNEFSEFYNLIEREHMDQSAIIALSKYCIEQKGFNLNPNYVITVAKDWLKDNIRTKEAVENRINELGLADEKMSLILSAMNTKRKIQLEDKELLDKWLNSYGFELNVIIFVVKSLKDRKRRLDVNILDEYLTKYFSNKLMSIQEIENYEINKENLYLIATTVNKELGIFYEDLSKEIDTYVVAWQAKGFDIDTLKVIADNCFKSSIKTLEGFNNVINKLFKLGIINLESYEQYLRDCLAVDNKILEVLSTLGLNRLVNNQDRNFYQTWTENWGFSHEIIIHAATIANGKSNAIQYLNQILSNWNSQDVKTLELAKKNTFVAPKESDFIHNNYTKEQLSSLLTNLDEVEV